MGVTKSEFLAFLDDVERGCETTADAHDDWVSVDRCSACFYGAAALVRVPGHWFDAAHEASRLASRYDPVFGHLEIPVHTRRAFGRSRESIAEELRIAAKDGRIPFDPEPQP
jgi:hypothetical protein